MPAHELTIIHCHDEHRWYTNPEHPFHRISGIRTTPVCKVSSLTLFSQYSRSFSYVSPASCSHSKASLISLPQRYACTFTFPVCISECPQTLNYLNIAFFTPALLFSKVAYFLSPGMSTLLAHYHSDTHPSQTTPVMGYSHLLCLSYWPICAYCTLARSSMPSQTVSSVCSFLSFSWVVSTPYSNFATAAAMFMNSNSLPVALMQSLATTVPLLKWGPGDTFDAMFGRSLTYLVVFSTLGMIVSPFLLAFLALGVSALSTSSEICVLQ